MRGGGVDEGETAAAIIDIACIDGGQARQR